MDTAQFDRRASSVRTMVQRLSAEADPMGLELLRLVKMVANLYDVIAGEQLRQADLSGPRWRLLLRLWGEEMHGNLEGASPTHLSYCQNVSKNTISSLLRGLEEQGLVERALDPDDRRVFRIRLTDAGRKLVEMTAPRHLDHLNELAAGLTAAERVQLAGLLAKLHRSLAERPNMLE
jgi:DNA-binding MarR family transcriptional regulator